MGYEVYCHDGAEADDVMYTLSRRGNCFIFSHDKDMNYAINDKCRVIRVSDSSWKITTDIEVFAKYGIWPNEMPLFLALSGDSSDGVKGLNGVGKVTAAKWIRKYRNFDAICSSTEFRKKHSGCESQLETFLRVCTPQITDLILNRKIDPNYSVVNRVLMGLGMVSTAAEYRKREGFQLKFELPD
jgi:5'-3' exonuclease